MSRRFCLPDAPINLPGSSSPSVRMGRGASCCRNGGRGSSCISCLWWDRANHGPRLDLVTGKSYSSSLPAPRCCEPLKSLESCTVSTRIFLPPFFREPLVLMSPPFVAHTNGSLRRQSSNQSICWPPLAATLQLTGRSSYEQQATSQRQPVCPRNIPGTSIPHLCNHATGQPRSAPGLILHSLPLRFRRASWSCKRIVPRLIFSRFNTDFQQHSATSGVSFNRSKRIIVGGRFSIVPVLSVDQSGAGSTSLFP
jgi:hypothetical protein